MLEKYKKENKIRTVKNIDVFENEIELATFLFVCISSKNNRYNFLQFEREEILNTILNIDLKYINTEIIRNFIANTNKYKWHNMDLAEVLEIEDLKDFLKEIDLQANIETLASRFNLDNTIKNIEKLKKAYIIKETIKALEDQEIVLNIEKNILTLGEDIRSGVKAVKKVFFREEAFELLEGEDETEDILTTNTVLDLVLKLFRQELILVSGEPGTGKTSFVLDMALKLEKSGYSGIFFSLEMGKKAISNRALSISTGIPTEKFLKKESLMKYLETELKEEDKERLWKRIQKFREKIRRLEIVDTSNMQVDELERYVKNTIALRGKLDFIVVDYLQLLDGKGSNETERITYISKKLKQIAKDNAIVVIAVAQMSTEAKKEVQNANRNQKSYKLYGTSLKGSSQLDQDPGAIIFLTKKADDPSLFRLINLQIAKQRNDNTYEDLEVEFHLPTQSFLYRRMVERFNYVKPKKKEAEAVKEVKKDEVKVVVEQQKIL
jgi:replicative DNA helicase